MELKLDQDMIQWQALVMTVMNLWIPKQQGISHYAH
jgi:hypothetical protein